MNNLEEKFKELGYEKRFGYYYKKYGKLNYNFLVRIEVIKIKKRIRLNPRILSCHIEGHPDIIYLQQTLNEMQKDLKDLEGAIRE